MFEKEAERIGKRLFREGLVGGNFGNMSVREGDGFFITRNRAFLDEPGDLVPVPLEGPVPPSASSESLVHRMVYATTDHRAIVHAHPAHAVACSFAAQEIIPRDSEGQMFCPVIPVSEGKPGTDELAASVAAALKASNISIARGHGTFAAGMTLEEAYLFTSIAEHSCRVLGLRSLYRKK